MKITLNHTLSLDEIAHIERTIDTLRHMAQVSHIKACEEFRDCHPYIAQMLRDYITACLEQDACIMRAQAMVGKMYRFIMENGTEHGDRQDEQDDE